MRERRIDCPSLTGGPQQAHQEESVSAAGDGQGCRGVAIRWYGRGEVGCVEIYTDLTSGY